MANIIIIDDDPIAVKALSGILHRGSHQIAAFSTPAEALAFAEKNLMFDLVFLELHLKETKGWFFLESLSGILKKTPVVVYTSVSDKQTVRRVLQMGVRNYLIKPYNEPIIFQEIERALDKSWRVEVSEDPETYCKQMGFNLSSFKMIQLRLLKSLKRILPEMVQLVNRGAFDKMKPLIEEIKPDAEELGFWGLFDDLEALEALLDVEIKQKGAIEAKIKDMAVAHRMLFLMYCPEKAAEFFIPNIILETQDPSEAERKRWMGIEAFNRCPIIHSNELIRQIDQLSNFPVVESVAAAFKLVANNPVLNVSALDDLVEEDPALSATILRAANMARTHGDLDTSPIEDPTLAIQLLGSARIKSIAYNLETIQETHMQFATMRWTTFWLHQNGCANMAKYICESTDLHRLISSAFWGALMHDVGKLIICNLHPFGWQAIVRYAQTDKISIQQAASHYLDYDHLRAGFHMAEKSGFPIALQHAIRYHLEPDKAPQNGTLCAIVGLSKYLCIKYGLGNSGEIPIPDGHKMEDTIYWEVLRPQIFPGFNPQKFESQAHRLAISLKSSLTGKHSL
jgi:response regulator RpfG family c-di-GMP phosphodiesterase